MPEQVQVAEFPAALPYRVINAKHPRYCGAYLCRLKALYKGGQALLGNRKLLEEIFPRYRDEAQQIYDQRCKRAFYVAYAGEILNFISASMSAERLQIGQKPAKGKTEGPELDDWWAAFARDVSPPGGKACDIHDLAKAAVLDSLQVKTSWHRVDLPKTGEFASLADQTRDGALDAYVVPVPAECVIDWEEDESGELIMLVTHTCESKRTSLAAGREMVTETWRVYTRAGWARYELVRKPDEEVDKEKPVPLAEDGIGAHSFGRVPFVRLDLPDGLWAMDNIEGMVREHFNKRSALAWAEFQTAFQELYEFLGPEEAAGAVVIGQNQSDANRAKKQRRGQGFVQERGKDDRAEFVGPDPGSFEEIRKSCDDLRTEIHRVTHQMALAVDNSAAALKRSADSKGQDKASAVVVFEALGQLARKFIEDICDMVARGRGDAALVGNWQATGMAKFDAISVDAEIDRAVNVESVSIPSPTFQRAYKLSLAKNLLGDEADEETLAAIEDELAENITSEAMQPVDKRDKVDLRGGGDNDDGSGKAVDNDSQEDADV